MGDVAFKIKGDSSGDKFVLPQDEFLRDYGDLLDQDRLEILEFADDATGAEPAPTASDAGPLMSEPGPDEIDALLASAERMPAPAAPPDRSLIDRGVDFVTGAGHGITLGTLEGAGQKLANWAGWGAPPQRADANIESEGIVDDSLSTTEGQVGRLAGRTGIGVLGGMAAAPGMLAQGAVAGGMGLTEGAARGYRAGGMERALIEGAGQGALEGLTAGAITGAGQLLGAGAHRARQALAAHERAGHGAAQWADDAKRLMNARRPVQEAVEAIDLPPMSSDMMLMDELGGYALAGDDLVASSAQPVDELAALRMLEPQAPPPGQLPAGPPPRVGELDELIASGALPPMPTSRGVLSPDQLLAAQNAATSRDAWREMSGQGIGGRILGLMGNERVNQAGAALQGLAQPAAALESGGADILGKLLAPSSASAQSEAGVEWAVGQALSATTMSSPAHEALQEYMATGDAQRIPAAVERVRQIDAGFDAQMRRLYQRAAEMAPEGDY